MFLKERNEVEETECFWKYRFVVNMDYLPFDNPSYKSRIFPLVNQTSSKALD